MKNFKITLEVNTDQDEKAIRDQLTQIFSNVDTGGIRDLSVDELGDESYEKVATIEAEWGCHTVWQMDEILEALNGESESTYSASDITSTWIKWNTLNVETKDGKSFEIEGDCNDIDYKNPTKVFHYDHNWTKLYEE